MISFSTLLARARRFDPVWAVALAASPLALAWAIARLGDRPLWLDELYTLAVASPATPHAEAMSHITGDVHPPLYYLGLRAWLAMLHTDAEWAARAFNLLALVCAAAGAAWAVRIKVDAPMALWCALLFTSFGVLWYVQEARMYAFLIADYFLICIVALAYEKLRAGAPGPSFIAATILAFVVLPFTHWFAGLFAGLVLLGLFALALLQGRRAFALLFFLAGAALGGLGLAWVLVNWSSTGDVLNADFDGGLALWEVRVAVVGVLLFGLTLNPLLILAAGWAGFDTLRAPQRRPALTLLLLCAALMPPLILFATLHAPMYQPRYFVGSVAPLTLFAAIGVAAAIARLKLTPARAGAALATLLTLSLALGASADGFGPQLERDQWREAGAYVRAQPGCADAPIAIWEYWADRPAAPEAMSTTMRIFAYYAGHPERFVIVYRDDAALPEAVATGPCAIVFWVGHADVEAAEQRALQLLGPDRDALDRVDFRGNVLFVRKSEPAP